MSGLRDEQIKQKRQQFGYNELPDREKRGIFKIILTTLTEPMIFLLLAVVGVYFLLGDRTESLVLLASVVGVIAIGLAQELKTEKALDALRSLSSPMCNVIRNGQHMTIPSRELVPGDIAQVAEGGRVPADGQLIQAESLSVDESLLTGESLAVEKDADKDTARTVYSSTMVVKGHGLFEVTSTGIATEVGKIGDSLNKIKPEKTLLKKEVDRIVKIVALFAVGAALLLALAFWLMRGNLLSGFLAGLTLSIAMLPEEFPVVLTVFMALGSWRLAKKKVLARKSSTIETLGSASVLCTDKTGTLTQNRMTVIQVADAHGTLLAQSDKAYDHIISFGVLASQMKPFDPMEEAFIDKAKELLGSTDGIYNGLKIIEEYPLEAESLSVVHVWGRADKTPVTVALKGAPEEVARLCRLSEVEVERIHKQVTEFAGEGLRVLGIAEGVAKDEIPATREDFSYTFLGLVALADPIRPEAAPAVQLCREAGIRVIMITGDYPETARRIGGEVGLDNGEVITGAEFEAMTPEQQDEAIRRVSIFSRVVPAHKLTIVESLKRQGEVVAMTGDGVNDAPALKSAHIGIAMGNRGTDVAREASSIVLLDDNFASIVQGVRLGRRIFANLRKAMSYILTVHVPIIVMSLLPVLFGWPLVLLPIHIVFLEFIIDPSCTLIFEGEREEAGTMKQPPRRLNDPLFSRHLVIASLVEGLVMSAVTLATHVATMHAGWPEDKTRALTFLLIALMNIALIVVLSGRQAVRDAARSHGKSPMLVVVTIVLLALGVVYFVPAVTALFKFQTLSLLDLALAVGVSALAALVLLPIRKLLRAATL